MVKLPDNFFFWGGPPTYRKDAKENRIRSMQENSCTARSVDDAHAQGGEQNNTAEQQQGSKNSRATMTHASVD